MMELLLAQTVLLVMAVAFAGLALDNLRSLPRAPGRPRVRATPPFVSVCIPARNEEGRVGRCALSLARQRGVRVEVLVFDDASTDGTAREVARAAAREPAIRLLRGTGNPPPGWTGKNAACHRLAEEARGEFLFFTDADTVHGPWSLAAGVAALDDHSAGLASSYPTFIVRSFWGRALVPLTLWLVIVLLPVRWVRQSERPGLWGWIESLASASPSTAAASGAWMLWRRDAYDRVGGHRCVAGAIMEDTRLMREAKAAGVRVLLLDAHAHFRCTMYETLAEAWRGFGKNLWEGMSRSVVVLVLLLAIHAGVFLWPFVAAPVFAAVWLAGAGPVWAGLAALASLQAALVLAIRVAIARRFGLPTGGLLLEHPAGMAVLLALMIHSARASGGAGVAWKGRVLKAG